MNAMSRRYSSLRRLTTFEDRFDYLKLRGEVGSSTFGFDRYLNQNFYRSRQWKQVREEVIARDEGCDLGIPGYEIHDKIIIHHMNPMTMEDLEDGSPDVLDPRYLISTTHRTHNAIHFGDKSQLVQPLVDRTRGDTQMW